MLWTWDVVKTAIYVSTLRCMGVAVDVDMSPVVSLTDPPTFSQFSTRQMEEL